MWCQVRIYSFFPSKNSKRIICCFFVFFFGTNKPTTSVFAGFYTAIELVRSKLFYLDEFSMQLKLSDYHKIQNYHLLNTVLFENLPQVVLQIIYCSYKGEVDVFVATAMLFSILSIVLSSCRRIAYSRVCVNEKEKAKHNYRAQRLFKIKIESNKIKSHHAFTHTLLTHCICSALKMDNTGNIEVFYVYHVRHALVAYVEISNIESLGQKSINNRTASQIGQDLMKLEHA